MESKLPAGKTPKEVTEGEWKTILSPEQFRILRMKGTPLPVMSIISQEKVLPSTMKMSL